MVMLLLLRFFVALCFCFCCLFTPCIFEFGLLFLLPMLSACVLVVMCTLFSGRLMKMLLFLFFVVDIIKHHRRLRTVCCTNKAKRQAARTTIRQAAGIAPVEGDVDATRRNATRFLPSLSVVKVGHCEMTAPNQPGAQTSVGGAFMRQSETNAIAGGYMVVCIAL